MRIVFAGTPLVAADTLRLLLDSGAHEVVGVITRPDAARGRSGTPAPSPVAALADERELPVLRAVSLRGPGVSGWLGGLAPDCCAVVAYGGLVPASLLDLPGQGWINVHYSLLPRWRGAAPVQRAILAGDEVSGVTVFRLVEELDAGPVLATSDPVSIGHKDAGELLVELTGVGAALLGSALDALAAGTAASTPQPEAGVTLAPKIFPEEARLDWSRPAVELDRLVRACNPAPGAWTLADGQRLRVLRGHDEPADGWTGGVGGSSLAAGELGVSKHDVFVGTGAGVLRLVAVQPPGRRPMAAADWGRGLRERPVLE